MLWLLQNNYVQAMTGRLARALHHTGQTLLDFSIKPDEDFPLEPSLALTPHFCYGSTGMLRRLRKSPSWCAGIFGTEDSLDQRYWQVHLSSLLLNPEQEILTFEALCARPFTQPYFVRPLTEQKAFGGQVVSSLDLTGLSQGRKGVLHKQSPSMLVAVSPVVANIHAEYRFVILNGEARLGSQYRRAGQLDISPVVAEHIWQQAQIFAGGWMPADFIVMDMAVLHNGECRVIEFNSVHSSGLYAIDAGEFATVVEEAVALRNSTLVSSSHTQFLFIN